MRLLSNLLVSAAAFVAQTVAAGERCFPDDFLFGAATASYQVEGAAREGGRTPSIWDEFCHERPEVACANVADDFFHRYKSDIQLMVETGLTSFRFSISWSRVMNWDSSTQRMKRNQPGIDFYHDLIDELLANNIKPIMTIYHFDLPIELHNKLSPPGWLNDDIVGHFLDFAELSYQEFGNKVEYWATFNEPWIFVATGYAMGMAAPGYSGSDTQAYTAGHNVLLSHASAVQRFRELQASNSSTISDKARIGIVLPVSYSYPLNASDPVDVAAADRQLQFTVGWFLQPIISGDYPLVMRERVGERLPMFTQEQAAMLKGSYDLLMLNHYTSTMVTDCSSPTSATACSALSPGWEHDMGVDGLLSADGSRLPQGGRWAGAGNDKCVAFGGYAPGYLDTIKWMHKHDPEADILLTENGWCGNETIDNQDQLWYYQTYLDQVHKAITEEKIPVVGYTAWSFYDNYEWGSFKPRFGLYYVNWTAQTGSKDGYTPKPTNLARIPRTAAKWYAQVAKSKCLDDEAAVFSLETSTSAAIGESFTLSNWVVVAVMAGVAVGVIFAVAARRTVKNNSRAGETAPLL